MAKTVFVHGVKAQMIQTAVADLGQTLTAIGGTAIAVTDDDSAASNGTDVLIGFNLDGVTAFLNSTNAGKTSPYSSCACRTRCIQCTIDVYFIFTACCIAS